MMIEWLTKYDTATMYYGVGFIWTNNAGLPPVAPGGTIASYRTLTGMGV